MTFFLPSYNVYRQIICDIQSMNSYMDYTDTNKSSNFIIMRHDVEFSIDRAYQMSLLESDMNFLSTYFIQITNNSYNAFSKKNIALMLDMAKRGHRIGLHYHLNGQSDETIVRDGVRDQLRIMSEMVGLKIDRFSFHRPVKQIYYHNIHINEIINAYSPAFFTYKENVTNNDDLDIKYISDSKHQWNYGYPCREEFLKFPKIQILIHPFSWTEQGYDNAVNFITLIREKQNELIETMDDEFLRFHEARKIIENAI